MAIAILQASRKGKPIKKKEFILTENGTHYLLPDNGYSLGGAIVNVNVQPKEQNKTLEIYENGEYSVEAEDGETLTKVTVIADVPGTDGDKGLIDGSVTSYAIPESITAIRSYCFYQQNSLKHVTIPEGVETIGRWAFGYCENLKNITLPDSITNIEASAFEGCTNFTSITVPASVATIGAYAFKDCSNCLEYDFSNHKSVPNLIGSGSFLGCSNKMKIIVPVDLYDEWTAATNWATYKDHIIGFGAKSAPKEEFFNSFVGADLLQDILNYNFLGVKLAAGAGRSELLDECGVPYLRIYGDGASPEAYAQIQNIEGRKTGKHLVFAYRLPTSNPESHHFFQIYVNTTGDRPTGNGDLINIGTSKDGKWHVIAIDIAEAIANQKKVVSGECSSQFLPNADGTYTIERLRIDFFNELTSTGSYVDVAYVGTCDNLELARSADSDYTGAEIDNALLISRLSTKASLNLHNNLMPYVTITDTTNSSGEKFVEIHNSDIVFANTSGYVGILYRAYGLGGSYGQIYIGSSNDTYNYSGSIVYNGDNNWNFGIIEIDISRYKDSVCRKLRFDYFNGLSANTQYSIDVAFIKFFGSEVEANNYFNDFKAKYNLDPNNPQDAEIPKEKDDEIVGEEIPE